MGSLVKASGKYTYIIEKLEDDICEISFYSIKGDVEKLLGKSKFDIKDAAKCGLANKETFKNFPRNMLLCRALANGCRWYAPEIICGYYAVEELEEVYDINKQKSIVTIEADGTVRKEENGKT